jgi:hypothetical protein
MRNFQSLQYELRRKFQNDEFSGVTGSLLYGEIKFLPRRNHWFVYPHIHGTILSGRDVRDEIRRWWRQRAGLFLPPKNVERWDIADSLRYMIAMKKKDEMRSSDRLLQLLHAVAVGRVEIDSGLPMAMHSIGGALVGRRASKLNARARLEQMPASQRENDPDAQHLNSDPSIERVCPVERCPNPRCRRSGENVKKNGFTPTTRRQRLLCKSCKTSWCANSPIIAAKRKYSRPKPRRDPLGEEARPGHRRRSTAPSHRIPLFS